MLLPNKKIEERSITERRKSASSFFFFFLNKDKKVYFILAELFEIPDVFWLRSFHWLAVVEV